MYKHIDHPVPVAATAYEHALHEASALLQREEGVVAVYQIGGVSTPGISDLDMVVVFGDDAVLTARPSDVLRERHGYLFIHNLYGATRTHFEQVQPFSFFHNYRLLWGEDVRREEAAVSEEATSQLKRQIALEYLVKLYMSMTLQRTYRTLKVRSFLLHVKAVAYDLEFLGIDSGDLYDLTHRFIGWRNTWFDRPPERPAFEEAFDRLYDALQGFLSETLDQGPFYLPGEAPYQVAKNLWLLPGVGLGGRREGVRVPRALSSLGNRYMKLSNRLNRFYFTVPVALQPPPVLSRRFNVVRDMASHNQRHLPGFDALTSSL